MTPEDFEVQMKEIAESSRDDTEISHSDADDLLCRALRQLGYGNGIDQYHKINKWYA